MRIVAGRWPFTEGSLALTDDAPGAGEWLACHCCGRSYAVENLVRFHDHPDDAVCVRCVAWLYSCSRPIVRKADPILRIPARIRAWLTRTS